MKTYRILGVLWLVADCVGTVTIIRTLLLPAPMETRAVYYCTLGFILLLDLAGVVASISLIRGARWARWFLGVCAVLFVLGSTAEVLEFRSFSVLTGAYGAFALVSAVLLLMPRRYVAS
ncbi:MAG TPA: hypothetical protein VN887_01175 [Candidatus Angelobacter sp.]|nr:hypothetical protein [Candidatus Angelobacter sp.]